MFVAGGGFKPGMVYGATDEFGYHAAEDRLSLYDFNATALYCLGIDHKRLSYRFQGLDYRLTNVFGKVINKLLA